ncbi:MAG: MBL fold metallo-hydrolase [Leptospiraceae bacterium]|nr:MBL fold metallo-hydrolase [Leptospiraceae bacterium]
MFKKSIAIILVIIVLLVGLYFRFLNPFFSKMSEYSVQEIDPNLTLIFGGGGNSAILTSDTQVLVIDTKMMGGAKKLFEKVQEIAKNKSIIIINTHLHGDHTFGNSLYKNATIIAGAYTEEQWKDENGSDMMPTEWIKDSKELQIGDETVVIKNMGQAHTYNDLVVYFKKRKILFFGDLVMTNFHPFFKLKDGSIIQEYYKKQNQTLVEFAPEKIVPGHGPMGGEEVVKNFQLYLDEMRSVAEGKLDKSFVQRKYKDWPEFLHMSGVNPSIQYWKDELKIK